MSLPTPYFQDEWSTIYCGDCREILPLLGPVDSIITDPVWPNAKAKIAGCDRPFELLSEALLACPEANRLILQFGCDSDPRIMAAVPKLWRFFRVIWLEYAAPTRKGRLLYTGDVAYVFGLPPKSSPGRRVMGGRYMSTKSDFRCQAFKNKDFTGERREHPCPRRLQHLQYLVGRWVDGVVLDPFLGSGTTLLAARQSGHPAIGVELEEKYCEIAKRRLAQGVLIPA